MRKKLSVGVVFIVSMVMVLSLFSTQSLKAANPKTFVGCHGQLKVQGSHIVDANGQNITLRGMSLYAWSSAGLQYYNPTAIERLVKEWKCTVIRVPILPAKVSSQESLVKTAVDACIANGVYVIIDWHSMTGANAQACSDFMKRMATAYGNTPNVLYETWNEPEKDAWSNIKSYHEQVIAAIRPIDPDNIIICGNSQWDQKPQEAAANPINAKNIVYSMHYYAATHKQWLRDNTSSAMSKGAAIFASEYGTGAADGNGTMDANSSQEWWNYLDANGIGSCNWSVSALSETTAAFKAGTSATAWTDSDLKPSGSLVKNYLIKMNTPLWDEIGIQFTTNTPIPTNTTTPINTPTSTTSQSKSPDLNGDRVVNMQDVILLAISFNTITGDSKFVDAYDLNSDGTINMADVIVMAGKFNAVL